jgi:putative nucleotidyltransferase with HDIG domain
VLRSGDYPSFSPDAAPASVAAGALRDGRAHEHGGRIPEAVRAYRTAIDLATQRGEGAVLAEALRRLGGVRRRRHEMDEAVRLCRRSHDVAQELGNRVLAAEALNGVALALFWRGEWESAREALRDALALADESPDLCGRIEQNLGVMASSDGDTQEAMRHYQRSLKSFLEAEDELGCATAYHNLGMISAGQQRWQDAETYYSASLDVANATSDINLRAHVLLNRTEVYLARQQFEDARRSAEEALQIFDRIEARDRKAMAYKLLGVLYRETGYPLLAEARFQGAMTLAAEVGAPVQEAEATRELALLYQRMGRNQDALRLLNASHRLFSRLNARTDLLDVGAKVRHVERLYLDIVRDWGRSIESSDSYTFGHSERVATYAVMVGTALGLEPPELTTLRIGAYLHDVGKMLVPHEVLNKPGELTPEETELMQRHPLYGLELLAAIDFPWNIKPIIRSHHEHRDGTGYPDRLKGDEIPILAQVICIVDVFDAMTTTRPYNQAVSRADAVIRMHAHRGWWRPEVFEAFARTIGRA